MALRPWLEYLEALAVVEAVAAASLACLTLLLSLPATTDFCAGDIFDACAAYLAGASNCSIMLAA